MRPVHYGDVSAAARALTCLPRRVRIAACREMLAKAEGAADYLADTGRCHPFWGNGSLMAVARRHPLPPEPALSDPEYARCFELVLFCLRTRRIARSRGGCAAHSLRPPGPDCAI